MPPWRSRYGQHLFISSAYGLPLIQRQAITWTNADFIINRSREQTLMKFERKYIRFLSRKCISKCRLQNGGHFVHVLMCKPHSQSNGALHTCLWPQVEIQIIEEARMNEWMRKQESIPWLTYCPMWSKYMPAHWGNIGSGNGLSPIRLQTITWADAELLSIVPIRTKLQNQNMKTFIEENALANGIGKMSAILSRGKWVNSAP